MIEHAPFEVVAYTTDGRPTLRADAVVAKGLDGWGLARPAMSPGHSLRVVAPPEGPEPWLRGPDAVVELRTPGDGRWYPVDRGGEWGREGFADPWAALAAVRARPVLRDGALAKSRRGSGRRAAIGRMGGDDAFVALRFGQRVVVWPVNQCEACGGDGMASGRACGVCGGGGRVTRGGDRRFWLDGFGAPAELLDAEQAAAAIDVIIGTTNTATEADRAAWGLDMANRGEANDWAPTVRQREVLSRVGDDFTLAELQESACHRYAGHTRRMASEMVARGAIEALGDGRYRKTALAVPSCVREPSEPARPTPKPPRASKKPEPSVQKPRRRPAKAAKSPTKPKRASKAPPKPASALRAQVGDRMVMPASFNRLEVAEVRPDGRVMVRDRHGDLHGPWSIAAKAARIWFRPRTGPVAGGSRVVLDPINDDARAVEPDAPARLAAHWADAAVFLPVLGDDQRRFLIAVAELGVAPVSAVLERLGWTLARLRQVVPSITSMAQSHDMPLPFVAATLDGERVWLWRPDGGDVMPVDPLAAAVRDVPTSKSGIYGVATDGRVLPIGVAKHNSRLTGAKKALPLVLDAIDALGPWTVVAVRPGRGRPQHIERVVAERLIAEAPVVGKRIERVVLYTRRPHLLAEAGPEPAAPPTKRVDFKAFTVHQDHSDGSKVYAGPDGSTALLRAGKMWWVLRLAADRVWVIVAGPSKFAAARSAALEAAGQPAPVVAIPAQLAPVPSDAEIDDAARGAGGRAAKMLRKLMTVAQRGDRVVLDPLAGAPMVVRLAEVEAQSPRFWERNPVWTVENSGQSMGAREVGKVVAQIAAGQRSEPTEEAAEGFDLGWLKHRLRAYGCTKLWAMTGSLRVLICGPDDTHTATINREADGWHWKQTYQQDEVGGGPFQRASALVDDLVARLGLTLQGGASSQPTFVLVGCVKGKAAEAAAARDLYRGALWDLRRRYAEVRGLPWGVVSGGPGVVGADERVEPYDQRIQDLTAAQRKAWAKKAQAGLERLAGRGAVVEVFASRPYVEALAKPAKGLGISLVAPLEGKGIGARMKWLAEQIAALGGEPKPASTADVREALRGWGRKGKPPVYTAPSGVVRFGRPGPKGQYRVQRREGGQWRVYGPDHRSFAKASQAAVELVNEGWRDDGGRLPTLAPNAAPDVAPSEQIGLTVDVGQPPADVADDRRLAWMIRRAAERLGRPTRGVWVVCGTEVHPIGALPDGIDVELPAVFVDMNPGGTIDAVDADPGFLLAVEPVSRALRRYRLQLTEEQRKRLLDALRLARGEGRRSPDASGIRRRLTEGFHRERVLARHEVWTDKARSMSWAAPKGATNDQVIEAFFAEMARRLAEGLPEEIRERAEQVLVRAFRMARRRGGPRPRMSRSKAPELSKPRPQAKPARPDRADALRGVGVDGQVEWESSVADFGASNAEDPALCARVKALGPGEHIDVGGGAAPHLRIQRRPDRGWPKAASKPSSAKAEAYEVIAGHHTRHGYPIWTVRLTDRVPKDRFGALKALAQRSADAQSKVRTGYFSNYRKNGATPGFVFGSEIEAQRFVRAAFGGREDGGGRLPTLAAKPRPGTAFADAARVSAASAAVLEAITRGMRAPEGQGVVMHRRFGEPPFAVDWLAADRFAVFEHRTNLDVADKTVEFVRLGPDAWAPVAYWTPDQDFITRDGRMVDADGQRAAVRFVDRQWMPVIRRALDGGKLPARRFERYFGGGERELGLSDAETLDAIAVEVRGRSGSGIDVFAYRPGDGFTADVSFDGIGSKARVGSLLAKVALHGAGPWWLFAVRGAGMPTKAEREGARAVLDVGGAAGAVVERALLVAGDAVHDLSTPAEGREDDVGRLPTLAARPKPGGASDAVADWPEVPFLPGPRTVANVRAVRIAHEAKRSGATPTPEQRRHLLQYSGWGGLSIEKVKKDWPDGIPLPNSRALVHEYYTPWTICADIAAVVRRLLGSRSGAVRALEPSAGVGRFVHTARFPGWHWTAIELSPLSALILDQTVERPAMVHEGSFESWIAANPERRFDVIISNPPYGPRGEQMVEDKDRRFRVKAAYQYFILRGLSILAPGGVAAFLVPGGFLTGSSNGKLRAKIDRDADLLAAFWLPSGTFPGARLSLDVVFFRARAAARSAPDSVFVDGTYFDNHPQHVLGEVKPSGRWGEPEVIGEYRGLPDFEPREQGREDAGGRMLTLPATDSFADPVRVSEPFVSLHALQAASNRAYSYGKAFQPGEVPTVTKAGWRAAVEDVVRSPRGKGQRLKDLRVALEDMRAAANKASAYEQSGKFTGDGLTRDDARQLVFRLRDGRDAIKAGIAAIKDQGRRTVPRVDVRAPRFRAWVQRLGEERLAGLQALPEWDTLRVTNIDGLAELEQARFIRVVAVDGHAAHIRLTDHGKKTLAAHPPPKAVPAVRGPSSAVVEASVVRDEPAGEPPKGLLGDALLGLDWNTPDEVYRDMLGRGITPAHAARAVATAYAHKHGASPADVARMTEELRLRNARPVDGRVVDIAPLPDPTAIPPGIGIFATRPSQPVVVLSAEPFVRAGTHNFDGMMQALAAMARGPWTIESRHTPPAREPGEFVDVVATIERVAKRHGVDIAEVRVGQSVPDAKGRHPRNPPIAIPEPKLPPLGDRKRTPKAKASARAARFADRGGTDAVWHIDGRAIARDSIRMVEIPTGHRGLMAFTDGKDAAADHWAESAMHLTVEMLHRLDERTPEMHATVDGKAFRAATLNKALSDEPVLRVHAGQLYVESGDPKQKALQVHLGIAEGANLLTKIDRKYLRPALAKISGPLTIRVMGRGTVANAGGVLRTTAVEWGNDVVILDRADGERHIIGPMRLNSVERLNELDSRPIISGPAAEKPATKLAPGFTGLELDDGKPARLHKPAPRVPAGLRDVEMERASSALTSAIERARFFVDPDDPTLRGMRIRDGLLVATDRKRLIEIAVDGAGPDRVIDTDGNRISVDYPEPGELFLPVDPIATVDPAPLGAIANRLAKLTESPVELLVNGPKLLLAGQPVRGATVVKGSTTGAWFVNLHRLRPALMGAGSGRILFGATGAPIVIERNDGERHLITPSEAPCETCPIPEPPPEPPPAPPKGPDEAALAVLLDRRLAHYEPSDTTRKLLLYPELAAALDAFAEVFGRRIAQVDRPFGIPELALDAHDARLLLAAHPAGVPLDRIADVDKLLRGGWRLDGARLLPKDDYLSGDLWSRIARLDAIPDAYKRHVEPQRRELEAAIGDISYPEIADRISLRDGWLPLHVIGAYLGSFRRDDKTPIPIERRDGVVQLANTRFTYDDMTDRFANTSSIRMVIGYINHDEQVFRPKKPQKEDINKVRRAKAELFERRFKAFLSTKPDLRDAIVDAYRRTHRGFVPRTYTGAPLQLARWGDLIEPHPHQNAGARLAVDQRGMVAAYGVGVGKTFTACATVALARQNVGTRRPVILVPNSLVSKWQRDIHKALPDFAVVTIGEKATRGRDGTLRYGPDDKADREVKWRRFAAGLYDLALVTPSAFLRTQLTAAEFEALAAGATELQRSVRLAQRTARGRTNPSERQQALLEQGVRAFLAEMMELPKSWEADDIRWSELGVDLLIVDEAQNYKGLHSPETREGSIPRFMGQSSASKRAWNLDARARDVRGRNGFVVLLSATPAKNSPLELYNLWSYVNGELWRDHGIHDPEAFISRFLTIEPRLVIDATMEATERPAVTGFKHLDELKSILLRWGEFIQPPDIGLEVPEPTTELVEVEMDERQEAKYTRYIAQVEAELDAMRRGVKSNKILGLLARMGLVAVHAELDRGLKYKSAKGYDPESPKFTAIADYILANNTCGHIVFVQAIAAHRWLKETLVERGIDADRIGILNAELAQSSDARQRVADRFNAGRLDVVIANSIAYEGLDLQTRTCAIHHADLPWEPATLNQRNGRAVRQGNTLSTVAIRYYFAQRSMDGLRFNLIQGKQGWMGALLEGSDAIANPGADLELGPDEILLLISRTPEETRKRLDALRAQAEAKRREEEAQRATKLLESGAGQLLEARDARTPERAEDLRAGAEAAFDALDRIDPDIWPWRDLLRAARQSGAVEILGRHGSPPLFPGCWLRWEGDWHHVGRFGWEGTRRTVWLREPGHATWESHKVSAVATNVKPDAVSATRPTDVTDNWQPDVSRVVQRNLGDAWRGWRTLGWNHADPAWLEAAWPPIAADAEQRIAQIRSNAWTGSYGPPETRFPYAVDGVVHIQTRGGPPPTGAELLPPTAEGWARWLTLATSDDFKLTVRDEASKWWWGRPLRPGMQRTRQNPSRPTRNRWSAPAGAGAASTQMHSGDGMQLPAQTPIGTHLVLGIDHGQRLVWLDHARGARDAQAKQKDVPADIPLVVIVQVDNNAVAETRRPMAMAGGPVFVQPALMKTGGGIVIAADGTDAIASVIHARDLDAAYAANHRKVPQGIPRTVIGTIRYLYREAG